MGRLASAAGHPADFARASVREKMGNGPTENPKPRHRYNVLDVVWLGKTHVAPKAIINDVQAFVRIMGFWKTFILLLAQCLHSLYCLLKKGCIWDWGSEQQ